MSTRPWLKPTRFIGPPELVRLTPAQEVVLNALIATPECSNAVLAELLDRSEHAAKSRVKGLLGAFRCTTRAEVLRRVMGGEVSLIVGYLDRELPVDATRPAGMPG